jgi:Zn-dependent protease with chaperone function
MNIAVYLPIVASLALGVAGPRVGLRLQPQLGVWLLTAAAAVISIAYLWALVLLAGTLMDELPMADRILGNADWPVLDPVAVSAGVMLIVGAGRAALATRDRWRLHRELHSACSGTDDDFVVLADPQPQAFTVPGRPGRIVVSQGMLRALSADQRRVLLAHERAHLGGHHGALLAAVRTAVAVNPLLTPVGRMVSFLCERWADEVAARSVGDRRLAAQALAAAALAAAGMSAGAVAAFHELSVGQRVAALQAPAPARPYRRVAATCTVLLCGGVLTADLVATDDFVELLHALMPF